MDRNGFQTVRFPTPGKLFATLKRLQSLQRTPLAGWLILPFLLISEHGMAQGGIESHAAIRAQAKAFVEAEYLSTGLEIAVEIGQLDSRLALAKCPQPLQAFWANPSRREGRVSVGVECGGEKPWKIYIQTTVQVYQAVAVLAAPKFRGEVLGMADIVFETRDVAQLNDKYLTDVTPLEGYIFKRLVHSGSVLTPQMLQIPKLVKRGQQVTILADSGGIVVRMAGQAMGDGGKGSVIKVKNLSSSRIIEGEVVDKGTVRIRF